MHSLYHIQNKVSVSYVTTKCILEMCETAGSHRSLVVCSVPQHVYVLFNNDIVISPSFSVDGYREISDT